MNDKEMMNFVQNLNKQRGGDFSEGLTFGEVSEIMKNCSEKMEMIAVAYLLGQMRGGLENEK